MKVFSLAKKVFVLGLTVLSGSITSALKCLSMNNQKCKVRPKIVSVSSNNPIFYPFSVKINRCSGNCNSINDPYSKVCVPDFVKNLNVKVFNLMLRANKTRSIKLHETCKCICRGDKIICNSKQRSNEDKCRCECKELIDQGVCIRDMFGILVIASHKSCNIGEYPDYLNCKCRKKLIDQLVEECTENINETKLIKVTVENENKDSCHS